MKYVHLGVEVRPETLALILRDADSAAELAETALNLRIVGECFAEVAEEATDAGRRPGVALVLADVEQV